jgi:hypothetical protein
VLRPVSDPLDQKDKAPPHNSPPPEAGLTFAAELLVMIPTESKRSPRGHFIGGK